MEIFRFVRIWTITKEERFEIAAETEGEARNDFEVCTCDPAGSVELYKEVINEYMADKNWKEKK